MIAINKRTAARLRALREATVIIRIQMDLLQEKLGYSAIIVVNVDEAVVPAREVRCRSTAAKIVCMRGVCQKPGSARRTPIYFV